MINQMPQYAASEQRFWDKWKKSGAVETIEQTIARSQKKDFYQKLGKGLKITAIGEFHGGPLNGYATLSLGEKVVNSGPGWSVTSPITYAVVPTHNFKLDEIVKELPKGSLTPYEAFGQR